MAPWNIHVGSCRVLPALRPVLGGGLEMTFATPAWDLGLQHWINSGWQGPWLDAVMPALSWSLWLWLAAAMVVFSGVRRGRCRRALALVLFLAAAVLATNEACDQLKDAFGRVRPYQALAGTRWVAGDGWRENPVHFVASREQGSSYPSAHAATTAAACALGALLWPAGRRWLWLPPLLAGLSRVYLGKHYPSDVLAGWLVGLAMACAAMALAGLVQSAASRLRQ